MLLGKCLLGWLGYIGDDNLPNYSRIIINQSNKDFFSIDGVFYVANCKEINAVEYAVITPHVTPQTPHGPIPSRTVSMHGFMAGQPTPLLRNMALSELIM